MLSMTAVDDVVVGMTDDRGFNVVVVVVDLLVEEVAVVEIVLSEVVVVVVEVELTVDVVLD